MELGEDGAWRQIALETPDHKTSLLLKPEAKAPDRGRDQRIQPAVPSFVHPGEFRRQGRDPPRELRLSEFRAGLRRLSVGDASLKWGADWSLGGEIKLRAMDPARFVPR